MLPEVTHANHVKLTYSGFDKWTATWQGFPSDNHAIVRRTIQLEPNQHYQAAATRAAYLFAKWLETGEMGDTCNCHIEAISVGGMSSDSYAVAIKTRWVPKPVTNKEA